MKHFLPIYSYNVQHLIVVVFLWWSAHGFAQNTSPYALSAAICKKLEEHPGAFGQQIAATSFAFQGDFIKALQQWNEQIPVDQPRSLTAKDSILLSQTKETSAQAYILERSRKEQIVILNELHHNPSHRVFARSLLQGLYAQGYRYLGVEALSDSLITTRKYATLDSGFYTAEPEMAAFLKEAIAMGFEVFGYEIEEEQHSWSDDAWRNREIGQAHNIYQYMQTHPEGKYFIYCGGGHVFEGEQKRGFAMAGVLAQLTQINPFTIDQNRYSYKADVRYNHPLLHQLRSQESTVLLQQDGTPFNGHTAVYETDVCVLQPATYSLKKAQLAFPKSTIYELVAKTALNYPVVVQVFPEQQKDPLAVPVAVVELADAQSQAQVVLPQGAYRAIVSNSEQRVQGLVSVVEVNSASKKGG